MADELAIVKEALRHTEERLRASNLNATASETRAMQFAAFNAAVATVLGVNAVNLPVPVCVYLASVALLLITFLVVSAALPRKFHVLGHFWDDWSGHLKDGDALLVVLISQAKENDVRILFNERALEKGAARFRYCYYSQFFVICFLVGSQLSAFI